MQSISVLAEDRCSDIPRQVRSLDRATFDSFRSLTCLVDAYGSEDSPLNKMRMGSADFRFVAGLLDEESCADFANEKGPSEVNSESPLVIFGDVAPSSVQFNPWPEGQEQRKPGLSTTG